MGATFAGPAFAAGTCPSGLPVSGSNCYFVAANGNDTNSGTSETTPWLHAPGMPNCANTCAGVTPAPGEGFVFRGGDTWHVANPSPASGVAIGTDSSSTGCTFNQNLCGWWWKPSWSGTSTSCAWPTTTSGCIYIGVDTNWYNSSVCGGSFCRPILNLDNPTSTSRVASCAYAYDSPAGTSTNSPYPQAISFGTTSARASYIIFDNFELTGGCGASHDSAYIAYDSIGITMEHLYIHGWTEVNGDTGYLINAANIPGYPNGDTWAYNVVDGSDSYCSGVNNCSGYAGGSFDVFEYSIWRRVGGAIPDNALYSGHDNLFEQMYESYDSGVHGDVIRMYGNGNSSGVPVYWYNNMVRNMDMGTTVTLTASTNGTIYFFNNVMYNIGNGTNCLGFAYNNAVVTATVYFANNTIDDTPSCVVGIATPGASGGTVNMTAQNNHMIGYTALFGSVPQVQSGYGISFNLTDNGNEIIQTEAAANAQGYTPGNNYQPTSTGGATYHAGGNLSSSCSAYSSDSALCKGSTGGASNTAGGGAIPTGYIATPPARGSTWDAGAYQYSGSTATLPDAPTDLVATVE